MIFDYLQQLELEERAQAAAQATIAARESIWCEQPQPPADDDAITAWSNALHE